MYRGINYLVLIIRARARCSLRCLNPAAVEPHRLLCQRGPRMRPSAVIPDEITQLLRFHWLSRPLHMQAGRQLNPAPQILGLRISNLPRSFSRFSVSELYSRCWWSLSFPKALVDSFVLSLRTKTNKANLNAYWPRYCFGLRLCFWA